MGLNDNQCRTLERYYREMYYPLIAYAKRVLYDRTLTEEAVQDTFRIACAKANIFLASPNPKGWLINTLKNVINNTNRMCINQNKRVVLSFGLEEELTQGEDFSPTIDTMYSDLTDLDEYKLLKRIVLDRYSILEEALELGISKEACKKRVQRAKKKLKKYLEGFY